MLLGEQANANWRLVGCNFWMPSAVVGHNARRNHVSAFAWALCWFWTSSCGFAFMEISFCPSCSCSCSDHVSGNGQDHGLFCKPICPSVGLVLEYWLQPCLELVFLWPSYIFACGARSTECQPVCYVLFAICCRLSHRTSSSWGIK